MFSGTAHLYDAVYDAIGKDYAGETARVLATAAAQGVPPVTILDVACGTGRHLEHFSRTARCAGVDLDPAMIDIARGRCPAVALHVSDMVELDLGERYDLVVCLFSSIGYVATVARLEQAVAAMSRHLAPGGLLLVEPWIQPEVWESGRLDAVMFQTAGLKGARLGFAGRDGDTAVLELRYLVVTASGFESFEETHRLALFTWNQYRAAFLKAGLQVTVDEEGLTGRGLLLGMAG